MHRLCRGAGLLFVRPLSTTGPSLSYGTSHAGRVGSRTERCDLLDGEVYTVAAAASRSWA